MSLTIPEIVSKIDVHLKDLKAEIKELEQERKQALKRKA